MAFLLIWPEKRMLTDSEVIQWALDLIADGDGDGLSAADVKDNPRLAASLIMDVGCGTFGKVSE